MNNKRGLFLTNVLSKVFERVLDLVTSEDVWMSEYQCGGQKQRGTVDNIIMMRVVIDNNVRLNKKTYCYFADAYKCFDKLWLKDCLVEMWRAGMREKEVMFFVVFFYKEDFIKKTSKTLNYHYLHNIHNPPPHRIQTLHKMIDITLYNRKGSRRRK